jgi:hypothetical protein
MPRRISTAKLLDPICAAAVELTKRRRYGGTQWVMVSQVEDSISVSGTEVQRAILLGAETGRLAFVGVPAHSMSVKVEATWGFLRPNLDRIAAPDHPHADQRRTRPFRASTTERVSGLRGPPARGPCAKTGYPHPRWFERLIGAHPVVDQSSRNLLVRHDTNCRRAEQALYRPKRQLEVLPKLVCAYREWALFMPMTQADHCPNACLHRYTKVLSGRPPGAGG